MHKNAFLLAKEIVILLSETPGVSGYEYNVLPILENIFGSYKTELSTDFFGNYYISKKGMGSNQSIMLAAHLDEIGLMISHIDERGFLHFLTVGGIDERTLIYQDVIVHGKEDLNGIICYVPFPVNNDQLHKTQPPPNV